MSKILATFQFRKPLPGIGNVLRAANTLLNSGDYRVRSPLNPLHPKHLYLEIFQSIRSPHPTLKLDLPLEYNADETKIKEVVQQIETSKSSLRFVSDANDESVSIVSELIPESESIRRATADDSSKYVLQHTFEIRKAAPYLDELLHCISSMAEKHENNLIFAFDAQTHRCLQINVFVSSLPHPIVVCSRRLKSPKKTDWSIVSQINLASSYSASVHLGYTEDSQLISVYVTEPSNFDSSSRMRLALSQIQ